MGRDFAVMRVGENSSYPTSEMLLHKCCCKAHHYLHVTYTGWTLAVRAAVNAGGGYVEGQSVVGGLQFARARP